MSTMFPRTGEVIALRIGDGHELVVRVRQADRPRIVVMPALSAPTNEGIEAAFVASDGTGYRLRGRVAHREMNETTIEVEGVTPLLGRFLRRFTPSPRCTPTSACSTRPAPSTGACRVECATWRWPAPGSPPRASRPATSSS